MRKHMTLILGGLTMLVASCTNYYYRVTDPTTGKAYYTTKVDATRTPGVVTTGSAAWCTPSPPG